MPTSKPPQLARYGACLIGGSGFPFRSGTGFFGEDARGLPAAPELGQKAMLLASNILTVPEGYPPDPGRKTLNGAEREPAAAFYGWRKQQEEQQKRIEKVDATFLHWA